MTDPKPPIINEVNLEAPDAETPTMADYSAHAEDVEDARRKGEL